MNIVPSITERRFLRSKRRGDLLGGEFARKFKGGGILAPHEPDHVFDCIHGLARHFSRACRAIG
jgi:hypothetical protein